MEFQGKLRFNYNSREPRTVALENTEHLEPAWPQSCFSVPGSSVGECVVCFVCVWFLVLFVGFSPEI